MIPTNDVEGVEFVSYQLKDVAYQWYEKLDQYRVMTLSVLCGIISLVLF